MNFNIKLNGKKLAIHAKNDSSELAITKVCERVSENHKYMSNRNRSEIQKKKMISEDSKSRRTNGKRPMFSKPVAS